MYNTKYSNSRQYFFSIMIKFFSFFFIRPFFLFLIQTYNVHNLGMGYYSFQGRNIKSLQNMSCIQYYCVFAIQKILVETFFGGGLSKVRMTFDSLILISLSQSGSVQSRINLAKCCISYFTNQKNSIVDEEIQSCIPSEYIH